MILFKESVNLTSTTSKNPNDQNDSKAPSPFQSHQKEPLKNLSATINENNHVRNNDKTTKYSKVDYILFFLPII